jgi:hypothetical protein
MVGHRLMNEGECNHIPDATVEHFRAVFGGRYKYTKLEKGLELETIMLASGTWRGRDGHTIYWPAAVVEAGAPSFLGKPVWMGHGGQPIGYISAAGVDQGSVIAKSLIYDQASMNDITTKGKAPSIEADVEAEWDPTMGFWVARSYLGLGTALVDNPACDSCGITDMKLVALEKLPPGGNTQMPEEIKPAAPNEQVVQLEADKKKISTELECKTKTLATLETKYGDLQKRVDEMEIADRVAKIVTLEKDFKVEKFLEGATDHVTKIAKLEAYFEGIKKVSTPVKMAISETAAKQRLDKISLELFGKEWEALNASLGVDKK